MTETNSATTGSEKDLRTLNAAIVGGGKGCVSMLNMVEQGALGDFRMHILGVADIDPDAPGLRHAREMGIPMVARDYKDLYAIPDLDLIIELTGSIEIVDEIESTRPKNVHLIDHVGARLFWNLHQAEEAVIQQRTEMNKRVENEREHMAQILDSIPDEILVLDMDMKIQDANCSFLLNNELTIDKVKNKRCYEVRQHVRGECQVAVENCLFFAVTKKGRPKSLVRKHFGKDGKARYASIVGAPWRGKDGSVVGMLEITRDITKRIRLEEVLQATEFRLKRLMEMAPQAIYVKSRTGHYIDVNPATCAIFGKKDSEILGRTDLELFSRESAEKLMHGDREAWRKRDVVSFVTEVDLNERGVYLSTVKFPILDEKDNPTAVCGISRDITVQKQAQKELNETREYLQNIINNSPVLIFTADLEGNMVSFNRGAEELLGYSASEVIGKPTSLLFLDPAILEELIRQVRSDKSIRDYSTELKSKNASPLPVSLTLSPLKDSSGQMIGTVAMCKDISHRKALMAQILQSERMAAVGRLASGVAHEINNPLAVISEIAGYLNEVLNMSPEACSAALDKELKDGLPKITKQVERGRAITHRLLSFARKTESRVKVAGVNAALEEILPFLEKKAHLGNVTIHREYQHDLPMVAVDELQLQEVFINLITNAIHAVSSKGKGNIWLATREEEGKIVTSVRDDGSGIDDAVRARIFDPFVTTKPTGQGTGLGLSICYGIVKRHDGEIRVISEPNQGATFVVILPATTSDTKLGSSNDDKIGPSNSSEQ